MAIRSISITNGPSFAKDFTQPQVFGLPPATYSAILKLSQEVYDNNQTSGAVTLTDAANIATDASLGSDFFLTLGGNRTMDAPTNPTHLHRIRYWITQDGTGSRTLTWNTAFRFSTDLPSPTLTTTADFMDLVEFQYNAGYATWDCMRIVKGFDATTPP